MADVTTPTAQGLDCCSYYCRRPKSTYPTGGLTAVILGTRTSKWKHQTVRSLFLSPRWRSASIRA